MIADGQPPRVTTESGFLRTSRVVAEDGGLYVNVQAVEEVYGRGFKVAVCVYMCVCVYVCVCVHVCVCT